MGSSRSAGDDDRVIRIGGQPEVPPFSPLPLLGRVEHVVEDSKVFNIKLIGKYKCLENGSRVHIIGTTTFEGWVGEIMEYDTNSRCIVRFYSSNKIPIEVKQGDEIWSLNDIADYDDASGLNDIEVFYDASSGGCSSNVIPQECHQMVTPPGGGFLYPWTPVQGGLSSPRVPSGQGNYQSSSDQRQGGIGYYGNVPPYDGSGSSSNVILQGHHQMVTPPGGGFRYTSSPVQGGFSFQHQTNPGGLSWQGGIGYHGNVPHAGSSSNVIPQQYYPMVPPLEGLVDPSSLGPVQGMPNNYPSPGIGTPSQHTSVPRNSREQAIMPPNQPRQIVGNQNLPPDNPRSGNQS